MMQEISAPSHGAIHLDSPISERQRSPSNESWTSSVLEAQAALLDQPLKSRGVSKRQLLTLVALGAASLLALFVAALSPSSPLPGSHELRSTLKSSLNSWKLGPSFGHKFPVEDSFCTICDCTRSPPVPSASQLRSGPVTSSDEMGEVLRTRMLDVYCRHVYASDEAALSLIRRHQRHPEDIYNWNLKGLTPGKPTLYLYTKTAPHSKISKDRLAYIRRHADTIARHRANVTSKGYFDGVAAEARQLIWIIVEDEKEISEDVAALLAAQSQPYIYMAFGPTRRYGNAQLNAALTLIHSLSGVRAGNLMGHGPVISADDDAEIHEDLLDLAWKVKKIGVWPMGNLGDGFEGPTWKDGKISEWHTDGDTTRLFPIDWGAFTYPSSVLGNSVPGPNYFPIDNNGGESDFLDQFVSGWDEIESICPDPTNCHLAWHDQPIEISHLWLDDIEYPFR